MTDFSKIPEPERVDIAGMYPVTLDKTDTCWTYCLKRIGYETGISSSLKAGQHITFIPPQYRKAVVIPTHVIVSADHNRIEEFFDLLPIVWPQGEEITQFEAFVVIKEATSTDGENVMMHDGESRGLQPGDLLMFTHNEKLMLLADSIDASGKLEYTSQRIRRHLVVYEGQDTISHAILYFPSQGNVAAGMQIELKKLSEIENKPTHLLRPRA